MARLLLVSSPRIPVAGLWRYKLISQKQVCAKLRSGTYESFVSSSAIAAHLEMLSDARVPLHKAELPHDIQPGDQLLVCSSEGEWPYGLLTLEGE